MYTRGCACTGRSSRHQSPLGAKVDLSGWSHDQGGWVGMKMREPGFSRACGVVCLCVSSTGVCVCASGAAPRQHLWRVERRGVGPRRPSRVTACSLRCGNIDSVRCEKTQFLNRTQFESNRAHTEPTEAALNKHARQANEQHPWCLVFLEPRLCDCQLAAFAPLCLSLCRSPSLAS